MKVYAKLGEAQADIRIKGMMDTIYKTRADSIAGDRAVSKLFGKSTTANSFFVTLLQPRIRRSAPIRSCSIPK